MSLENGEYLVIQGPPGTGKTYKLQELQKEYEDRFVTVTFHQSYGYEEFVEGIKAKAENNNITYSVEAGIFKQLCEKAHNDDIEYLDSNDEFNIENIKFADYLYVGQKFKTLTNLDFEIIEVKPTVKIKNSQNSIVPLSKESILSYLKQKDFNTTRGHFSYQPVIAKYIYDKLNSKTDFATKIEQYRKLLDDKSITLNTITEQPFNIYKSKRGITTDTNHSFSIEKLIEINNGILTSNPDGTYGKFIVEDINKRFPTANKKNQKN